MQNAIANNNSKKEQNKKEGDSDIDIIENKMMYLRISKASCSIAIIYTLIGQLVVCSDDSYANSNKKVPPIVGSGSGSLEKRSSYAVISQAMSQAVENEFGSEYSIDKSLSL